MHSCLSLIFVKMTLRVFTRLETDIKWKHKQIDSKCQPCLCQVSAKIHSSWSRSGFDNIKQFLLCCQRSVWAPNFWHFVNNVTLWHSDNTQQCLWGQSNNNIDLTTTLASSYKLQLHYSTQFLFKLFEFHSNFLPAMIFICSFIFIRKQFIKSLDPDRGKEFD